jgi:hypothetical protein
VLRFSLLSRFSRGVVTRDVFTAVFMGAILFSSSWIVTTFLGG